MTYMYTSHCSLFISLSCTPGDVYCLNNSCHGAQLTFDASTHCIVTSPTALDDLVGATLTFGANSKNTLECPGKCAAQIDLQAGACLHVNCPGENECPTTVTLLASNGSLFLVGFEVVGRSNNAKCARTVGPKIVGCFRCPKIVGCLGLLFFSSIFGHQK